MKKEANSHGYKKLSLKDLIIIVMSILALITLVFIVIFSKKKDEETQNQLNQLENNSDSDKVMIDEALGDLIINEVNNSGWLELYNNGNTTIDLSMLVIEVNGKVANTIENGTKINRHELLTIDLGVRIGDNETSIISIYNSQNQCTTSMLVPVLASGESYGRTSEGANSMLFMTPTKGVSNERASINAKDELLFSVPGGFYDSAIDVELIAKEGSTIYYTTDGTIPTTDSEKYEGAIKIRNSSGSDYYYASIKGVASQEQYFPSAINQGTILNAIEVSSDGSVSHVYTQSYFVGIGYGSDYANMPVISLTVNPEDMFDYFNGIYVLGRTYEDALAAGLSTNMAANFFNGWKKSAHIEYFEPNKNKTFEGDVDLSVLSDFSVYSKQKSFAITSKSAMNLSGSTLANYLNNNSKNLSIVTNKRDNNYKMREYLASMLVDDTKVAPANIYPCILFMDGEYWGGYMLKGNYDSNYFSEKYGVEGGVYVASNEGLGSDYASTQAVDEIYKFLEKNDLSIEENYNKFCEIVDIDSFIEYFLTNIYFANTDFGYEGASIWRSIKTDGTGYNDGKWRFALGTMDNIMDNGTVGNNATFSIDTYLQSGVMGDDIFWALMKNASFKDKLKKAATNMADKQFTEEIVNSKLEEVNTLISKMAKSSYNRYYGNTQDNFFKDEVEKIKDFFSERGYYVKLYTEEIIEKGYSIYGEKGIETEDETEGASEEATE